MNKENGIKIDHPLNFKNAIEFLHNELHKIDL